MSLFSDAKLSHSKAPAHIAIIMDGNGRWAEARGQARTFGHIKGARTAKKLIEHCARSKIQNLTLYAFSTENWLRPEAEVSFLMKLLLRHLRREKATLMLNNIQFATIGELERLPAAVREEALRSVECTKNNTGMRLTFALSYGGRAELAHAAQKLAQKVAEGEMQWSEIDEKRFSQELQTWGRPDPDLVIRTSGESRLSNFMLWQLAYSEIFISDTLWPDFTASEFDQIVQQFAFRERRFGQVLEKPQRKPLRAFDILHALQK